MAEDLKARHKLRNFFIHRKRVQSWSEAEEKYPDSARGVEKSVCKQIIRSSLATTFFNLYQNNGIRNSRSLISDHGMS